jgi:integrase
VAAWTKKLRVTPRPGHTAGYARSTVSTISKVLTMLLADAVDEQLIPVNPIRPRRRGRTRHEPVTEAVWATPTQALHVAVNAGRLAGPGSGVLILTAAWTGARWGELTGLHRDNLHLPAPENATEPGRIVIDAREGALHEVGRDLYLGPPQTAESARDIELPPFLTELLREHLRGHRHDHVFVAADGAFHRRSNFSRRAMAPPQTAPPTCPTPPRLSRPPDPA